MNKNRKIVAFICAMAMILSVFSSFVVVNAEEATRGFVFDNVQTSDAGKTITVDVKYQGYALGLSSFTLEADVPAEVKAIKTTSAFTGAIDNYADGVYTLAYAGQSNVATANSLVATLSLSLDAALAEDVVLTVKDTTKASAMNADESDYEFKDSVKKGTMVQSSVTLPKYVDPSITPAPTAQVPTVTRAPKPTEAPVPTSDPGESSEPTLKPGVEVARGIDFKNVKVDGNKATVDVVYVGYALGLSSFTVSADVPAVVTAIKTTSAFTGAIDNYADGVYTLAYAGQSNVTTADSLIATLELTLSDNTKNIQIELNDDAKASAMNADESDYEFKDSVKKGMPRAIVTIPAQTAPVVTPEPTTAPDTVGEVALGDLVDSNEANDTVTDGTSNYYLGVKVTDGSADAVYGEDFVAVLGDKELTESEYNSLVNGYFDGFDGVNSIKDVIDNLEFKAYKDGVKFYAELINDKNAVVSSGEKEVTSVTPDQPVITVDSETAGTKKTNVSTVSVVKGNLVTLTANVKNAVKDAAVKFSVDKTDYLKEVTVNDTVAKYEAVKTGTVNVTVDYVKGDTVVATKKVKVTITTPASPTTKPGSTTTTTGGNGTGPIAGSNTTPIGTGSTTPVFTDLDSVAWAQEAIYVLASRGIINGRDEYTFDPNANITRAEYCQILIGAISKTAEDADSSFDDVATDAWYYHAVSVASKYGIVSGYGDGNFGPNDLITRQDMALMTLKAAQVMNKGLTLTTSTAFADADQISDYALEAVATLNNAGIINGVSDTEFAPLAYATRAQAAKILYDTFVK